MAADGQHRDVDGDSLTVTSVTQGAPGSVAIEAGGALRYVPRANANGSDSFTYTVSDGATTSSATVGVTIRPMDESLYLPSIFR